MAAARRRRLSARIAGLLLAVLVVLPVAAAPSTAAPEAPDATGTRLTITSMTPVADGDGRATVRGRLTNTGTETLESPSVRLVPQQAGSRRSDIATWTEGTRPVEGVSLDDDSLDDLPAGRSTPFVLRVDADDLLPDASAGAAWVSIQTETTAVHTFIGVHRTKEYEPLGLVWGIPLGLPADRRLFGHGEGRAKAWSEAVGPDSRLARLTDEPPARDEAWLIDPTLLDVPEEETTRTAERRVRAERATALRDRIVGSRTLVLPGADADVAAGARSGAAARLVRPRVADGAAVAEELGARSNVLWPADGLATDERAEALDDLHADPTSLLVPDSSLESDGFTATGGVRTTGGTPLVVRDGPLSELVAGLTGPDDVVLARQQLVAETASILTERSGTPRTVLVVPDRGTTPDPDAWEQLRDASGDIPWVTKGDLASVLTAAEDADPVRTPRTRTEIRRATTPDTPRAALLSKNRAQQISDDQEAMVTFASVRSDGRAWRRELVPTLHQLTSARWRTAPSDYAALQQQVTDEVALTADDVVVRSGDVNFFADTGRLQITIVNRTDVELTNLVVRLSPGNPSLRIDDDPEPVTIGPGGSHTVTVQASALAAGQVPVHVSVATPSGHEVTAPATLRVKVRPTGASIYWVIGGAAALLLAGGTWRTVRGGHRPRTADEPTEES